MNDETNNITQSSTACLTYMYSHALQMSSRLRS